MERYATGIKKPESMMPTKSVYSREKEPYGMRTIYLRSSLRTLRYGHPRITDVSRS